MNSLTFSSHIVGPGVPNELHADGEFPKSRLAALRAAIRKWWFILGELRRSAQPLQDGGKTTCALCALYFYGVCTRCPVRMRRGGEVHCMGTPYHDYTTAYRARNMKGMIDSAHREVRFLEALERKHRRKA